jgi:hypothetical protein
MLSNKNNKSHLKVTSKVSYIKINQKPISKCNETGRAMQPVSLVTFMLTKTVLNSEVLPSV